MFLDELAGGVATTDAPAIARALGSDPSHFAGLVIAGFHALALVLDPPLLRLAERAQVRLALGAALLGLAAVTLGASMAASSAVLLIFIALYGPLSGLALSSAEGTLVELAPEARERTLARLTLAGAAGDLVVPALVALAGWRDSFRIGAAIAILLAILVFSSRSLARRFVEDEDEPVRSEPPKLREAMKNRALTGWTLASRGSDLMDEVALTFIAVHLHGVLDKTSLAIALTAWTAGGLIGPAALDRLLVRFSPMSLLAASSAIALPMFAIVIVARDGVIVTVALTVLGSAVACFHPIVQARAYAALPGHPGVVNAVSAIFTPLDIGAALAIGAVAGALGSSAALAMLALVPLAMIAIAVRELR